MQTIYAKTAGEAWINAIKIVLQEGGSIKGTDAPLTELLDLFVEIQDGEIHDEIVSKYADQTMVAWMINENFGGSKPVLNWGYSYGMRLHDFNGIDQIEEVVKKLKKNPEIKSATLSLMNPETDFKGHMPCIMTLDAKIREGRLHITGFFRSQDVGKKLHADLLAVGSIQKVMADQLGVDKGQVKIFISSAHIYEADLDQVKQLMSAIGT